MKKNILLMTSAEPGHGPCFTSEKRFPLGIGFLISVLRKEGHMVTFVDNYLKKTDCINEGILQDNNIDYLGIYANTICFRDTKRIIAEADVLRKAGKWHGKIVVGGPHTSLFPESIPDVVDFVVIGEGERAILDIVEERATERIIRGTVTEDLDSLPMPAYDYFQDNRYWTRVDPCPDDPIYTMNTSRGCPFHCRFCSVKGVWGKTYRAFSATRIVNDISFLKEQYGIKGVYFREDHFTFSRKRTVEFCELLLKHGLNIKWFCESRVNNLDKEILSLMKRSGCQWLYLGCESGSQRMLDYYKKGITVDQIRSAIRSAEEVGIDTFTSWIVGAPTETDAELNETLCLVEELKPTSAGFNVYMGLPGSELCADLLNSGDYVYIDDIGIVYTNKYNDLVKRFYGAGAVSFLVPEEKKA